MPKPNPLPPGLTTGPFTTRDALAVGVSARRLRNGEFDRSFWGIRNSVKPTDLRQRCASLALRMPESAFFSHSTAATLHRMPLPLRLESAANLHVSMPAPHRAPHANGICGHQLRLDEGDVRRAGGVDVTTVERTWCDLSSMLTLHQLVAAGDFLLYWRQPLTTIARLADAVDRRRSRRRIRLLQRARSLLSDRSESPPESMLRVILLEAGAPAIRVNHSVTDRFNEFVARTDLIIDEWRLVLEYQGDYHRTSKGQWRADMTRRSRVEAENWRVMELNADDLRDPIELMQRIRRRISLPV